jgi:hypothetical protein
MVPITLICGGLRIAETWSGAKRGGGASSTLCAEDPVLDATSPILARVC